MYILYIVLIIGRDESLSEAAMFWNIRKIESLPTTLLNRLNKVICAYDVLVLTVQFFRLKRNYWT